MIASRLQEMCAPGGSVDACISNLLTPVPSTPGPLQQQIFGEWVFRRQIMERTLFTSSRSYPDELRTLQELRVNTRALQKILRWSGDRAEGRCPEVSSGYPSENEGRFFIDRNEENLYQLVTPGPARHAFYFQCPLSDEEVEETTTSEDP